MSYKITLFHHSKYRSAYCSLTCCLQSKKEGKVQESISDLISYNIPPQMFISKQSYPNYVVKPPVYVSLLNDRTAI